MRKDTLNYGVVMKALKFLVKLLTFAVVGTFLIFFVIVNAVLGAFVWLPLIVIGGGKAAFDFVFKQKSSDTSF